MKESIYQLVWRKRLSQQGSCFREYLRLPNYRALRDWELKEIAPLTVLFDPHESGQSPLFEIFAFLSECFSNGTSQGSESSPPGEISLPIDYRKQSFYK